MSVIAFAVVVAGFGVVAPFWVKSPQQLAAETAAPSPSVLTALVEERVVSRTVVLRGEVTSPQVFEVTPSTGVDGAVPMVTDVRVEQGDEVTPGEVLLEVSGRPLVALPGEVPAYRDLRPGAEGEDIAQLQRALQTLGYGPYEADGQFGAATKQAVASFYAGLGYSVPTTGDADEAAVGAAEAEVIQLERRVEDARDAREDAETPAERERASRELDRAVADLNAARERLVTLRSRSGPMLPLSEFTFLPSFPARVHAIGARVGSQVEAPLVSLASGPLVVEAQASVAQRELVDLDMPVEIRPESGASTQGTITSIGELRTGEGGGVFAGHVIVATPETPLDSALAGTGARLVVEATSSDEDVLAVPVSALFASPDGTVYVIRLTPAGNEQTVTVSPELSGDGYVAVRPIEGDLSPGDQVLVGSAAVPDTEPDGR